MGPWRGGLKAGCGGQLDGRGGGSHQDVRRAKGGTHILALDGGGVRVIPQEERGTGDRVTVSR